MGNLLYSSPELNVVVFSDDSVITASTAFTTEDHDEPVQLPFVPTN